MELLARIEGQRQDIAGILTAPPLLVFGRTDLQ